MFWGKRDSEADEQPQAAPSLQVESGPRWTREEFLAELKRMVAAVESGEPAVHGVYMPGADVAETGRWHQDGSRGGQCVDLTAAGHYNDGEGEWGYSNGRRFDVHWVADDRPAPPTQAEVAGGGTDGEGA